MQTIHLDLQFVATLFERMEAVTALRELRLNRSRAALRPR